jgi:hypothetical protein
MSNKKFIDLSYIPSASAALIELGELEEQYPIASNWAQVMRHRAQSQLKESQQKKEDKPSSPARDEVS